MRWKVGHHDLKSGIRVYYFSDCGGTIHICNLGFPVGSVHDPEDCQGLAHFTEHVGFRGRAGSSGDPVYDMIDIYYGGMEHHEIFTTYAGTQYGGPCLYYRRDMDEVMPVLVNVLKGKYVDRLGLSIEKTVINNEYRQTELDDVDFQLEDLFLKTMYDTNPVRRGVLGDVNQLRLIKPATVKAFMERNYGSKNMFAVIFGPKREEAISFASKYLDDWPYQGQPVSLDIGSFDSVPKLSNPRLSEVHRVGLTQHYVKVGFATECYLTEDDAALELMMRVVERRLYDVLREKSSRLTEGCYHNPGFTDRSLAHGTIGAWFGTASLHFARYGSDAIVKEFNRLKEELIPDVEFENKINSQKKIFWGYFRNGSEELARLVFEASVNGDPDLEYLHSYPDRLNKLTPKIVRGVANKYFGFDKFISVMISPV